MTPKIIKRLISFVGFIFVALVWGCESVVPLVVDALKNHPVISGVLVETDKQEYRADEKIVVTITNNLDSSVTTFDQQAFCTIIKLEQQKETEWKEVRNCFSGAPSVLVTLKPATKTIVELPGLSPGIYRALIIFSLGEAFNFGKSSIAISAPFSVRSTIGVR